MIKDIHIGDVIKYSVREYGHFYGDGTEKSAITVVKTGKVMIIGKHDGRVTYYSVAPKSICSQDYFYIGEFVDTVWPEDVLEVINHDN